MKEVFEVIESYNEYIVKIPQGAVYIANSLREDKLNEALLTIKDFSEGLVWLSDAANLLRKNNVEVSLNIEKIHDFLNEINDGLEIQDFMLVADLFEYEIAPFFQGLKLVEGMNQ